MGNHGLKPTSTDAYLKVRRTPESHRVKEVDKRALQELFEDSVVNKLRASVQPDSGGLRHFPSLLLTGPFPEIRPGSRDQEMDLDKLLSQIEDMGFEWGVSNWT